MNIKFTPKQREMMKLAKEQGHITLNDTHKFYSDDRSRMNALNRLLSFGLLKDVGNQKFKFINQSKTKHTNT